MPHQITLLKLVDAYLLSGSNKVESVGLGLVSLLVSIHLNLSDAARAALGGTDGPPSAESRLVVDSRLPDLVKALVLTSQCLISMLLSEQTMIHNLGVVKAARSQSGMTVVEECIGASVDLP